MSLFLGAEKIPFGTYMAGGVLGTLPGVIHTIFGANIKIRKSPAFWLSVVLLVMISVFSILIASIFPGRKNNRTFSSCFYWRGKNVV